MLLLKKVLLWIVKLQLESQVGLNQSSNLEITDLRLQTVDLSDMLRSTCQKKKKLFYIEFFIGVAFYVHLGWCWW